MKAIKILDTDEKSGHLALTNFMGWTIDKEDHVLQIHRQFDGNDVFDNIQLKDMRALRIAISRCRYLASSEKVEELMEEFLADDDADILDISEYVDQEVMSRGDEDEEVCKHAGDLRYNDMNETISMIQKDGTVEEYSLKYFTNNFMAIRREFLTEENKEEEGGDKSDWICTSDGKPAKIMSEDEIICKLTPEEWNEDEESENTKEEEGLWPVNIPSHIESQLIYMRQVFPITYSVIMSSWRNK